MNHLSDLLELLRRASGPEEVFGRLDGDRQAVLRQRYRRMAALAHPDRHPARAVDSHEAFRLLQSWYELAQRRLASGAYGAGLRLRVIGARCYESYADPIAGEVCDLYPVDADGDKLLLKLARSAHDNDLLDAEALALQKLDAHLAGSRLRAHFPRLLERLRLRDAAGQVRRLNVIGVEPQSLALTAVLRAQPQGIDPRDAAWIFNRMLAALGATHAAGLVHGAVTLDHVLIQPADHNGILIDWCYSVACGAPLRAISPAQRADYPPEVFARQPATPATDLYMAARCFLRLLGAQGEQPQAPAHLPPPLRALIDTCLIVAPHRRADDAWQLFDDFRAALQLCYGPPAFRAFPIAA
ncbi:MAG: molecular chaperone DnaJ [Oscillochloris sp.]|nr:molecular chaperone DnaJ [Oscillochloris sp.]